MITICLEVMADGVRYTIYGSPVYRSPYVDDVVDGVGFTVYGPPVKSEKGAGIRHIRLSSSSYVAQAGAGGAV